MTIIRCAASQTGHGPLVAVPHLPGSASRPAGETSELGERRLALSRIEPPLPHGWGDLLRQVSIWLGFVVGYQVARGLAHRGPSEAFRNARRLIRFEEQLGGLVELDVQRLALEGGTVLVHAVNWTYWLSQFAVVTAVLLGIYLRRNEAYLQLRDTIIIVNTLGLVGYVALPTAPPRLFPERGFVDTLADVGVLGHGSALVELVSNPYAAMPSLHAADALIVGVALAAAVRQRPLKVLFLLWPLWVWFSLIASANHFWVDIAAGVFLAALGSVLAAALMGRRRLARKRR